MNKASVLDKKVAEEAAKRCVWFMKTRRVVNMDCVEYRVRGKPIRFSGLEVRVASEKELQQLVSERFGIALHEHG